MYGRAGSTSTGRMDGTPAAAGARDAIWDDTQTEERERTWDRLGDQDFVA